MHLHGKPQRLLGAVEDRQNAVAGDVRDVAAVVADRGLEQLDRLRAACSEFCLSSCSIWRLYSTMSANITAASRRWGPGLSDALLEIPVFMLSPLASFGCGFAII